MPHDDDDHDDDSDFDLVLPPWIAVDTGPIEVGSIVQLNSGGPLLTAQTAVDPIQCCGFERTGEYIELTVPAACLRKLTLSIRHDDRA